MKLYNGNGNYKLYHGNMLDMGEVVDKNTIDSIVCDPPYELNFMGKGWDNSGIAFQKETREKCLEVLKPGGYLLAFGGSRTYHRIACAIEDAGFEIRDCIMWLYGSGFPKSMNIGLAIDKKNGFEMDIKKATNERAGWGTALKPSYEIAILAKKPYDIEAYIFVGVINILDCLNNKGWLKLNARTAEKFSDFLLVKQNIEEDIALKNVGKNIFTNEDLLGVMDMLQSLGTENTNLSIVSLCLSFLAEICCKLSKYTTEMKINLITELKILKSLLVHDTSANTTQDKEMNQTDIKQSVLTVENFLTEELQKLSYMNTHFVQENATYNEKESNLSPSFEPIIVARKPCEGSCTDNVIKYGVGGINIDECRVGNGTGNTKPKYEPNNKNNVYGKGFGGGVYENTNGRFPANTILDSEEGEERRRYFYCAKASKRDRDEGLEEFEEKGAKELLNREENSDGASWNGKYSSGNAFAGSGAPKKNIHPTVKPTELMQYLVRLVTPNGGTVLDPFNGSGSTGKAVMYENKDRNKNYKYIGIELTDEYLPIAKARIEYVMGNEIKIKPKKQEIQNESREKSLFDF